MALQDVCRHLVFDGFEPTISMCNGTELILTYDGAELDANGIIEAMESRGYITQEDLRSTTPTCCAGRGLSEGV